MYESEITNVDEPIALEAKFNIATAARHPDQLGRALQGEGRPVRRRALGGTERRRDEGRRRATSPPPPLSLVPRPTEPRGPGRSRSGARSQKPRERRRSPLRRRSPGRSAFCRARPSVTACRTAPRASRDAAPPASRRRAAARPCRRRASCSAREPHVELPVAGEQFGDPRSQHVFAQGADHELEEVPLPVGVGDLEPDHLEEVVDAALRRARSSRRARCRRRSRGRASR